MTMKKIETTSLIVLVLFVLGLIISTIFMVNYTRFASLEDVSQHINQSYLAMKIFAKLQVLVNILIGIWLFIIVKKEKEGTPWFWLMLGVFTGVFAAILYFLVRIHQIIKRNNEISKENTEDF